MKARGLALYDPSGPGVAVRRAAAYPGERTGVDVEAGEVVAFSETATVQHAHSDGNSYAITFYRLAEGRGWVHDFDPAVPGRRNCDIVVSDSIAFLRFVKIFHSLLKKCIW